MVIKSVIIIPDAHLTDEIPKDYEAIKPFIKEFKPDKIILLGDFMDVGSLSAWDYDKKRKMEGKRFTNEIARANIELNFLEKYTDEIIYLEGNHEDRIERYLDKNPEMEGIIELKPQLRLKERKIKWVKMNDLYKLGDMYFTHGMYTNLHHARKHLQTLGCNICYGHSHTTQTAFQNMAMQKPHMAYALGTLGDKKPDYLKNRPGNWINQFSIFYYCTVTGNFNLYPINIIKGRFLWNGKEYGEIQKKNKMKIVMENSKI
jgi:predicted phosphodiesterase